MTTHPSSRLQLVPSGVWTPIPGTGWEVFNDADADALIGVPHRPTPCTWVTLPSAGSVAWLIRPARPESETPVNPPTVHRPVDTDAPAYLDGVAFAHQLLDAAGSPHLEDLLAWAELAARMAHQSEDTTGYLRARGFGDTLRDYQMERST